jgi:DNA-binding GntR family transcriptional regulator
MTRPLNGRDRVGAARGWIATSEQARGPRARQSALALRFASSVTPVRAALRQLHAGIAADGDPPRIAAVAEADLESIEGTYIARMLIEPYAAQRAALRISRREADALGALAGDIAAAHAEGNSMRASIANYDFHFALYDRCGIPAIPQRIRDLWSAYPWDILHVLRSTSSVEGEHRAIAEAVKAGYALSIGYAIEDHIAGGYRDLVRHLGREAGRDPFELDAG